MIKQTMRADNPQRLMREVLRQDFGSFLIRAFPYINGGREIVYNWHLDAIAQALMQVEQGVNCRLLVTLPPRNLKSIAISVAWVAWMLGRNPRLNFVCVSYSGELAAKLARDCRAIINSLWYRELFPGSRISNKRTASNDFEMTAGGGRLATSVSGTLTGRGGDIIIIDDPIKPDEALSETTRNAVNNWFHTTLASRLNDKDKGAIITIMQRLHQYDLAGLLLETGDWQHLSLPAIAQADERIAIGPDRFYQRRTGHALHPARQSLAILDQQRREMGSANFAAQFLQDPVPAAGNLVRADWLQTYEPTFDCASEGTIIQSWDTASKDNIDNDWSVCITAHVHAREVRILDVFRRRLSFPDLLRHTVRLAREHRANTLLIEDQSSGTQLIQSLHSQSHTDVPRPLAQRPEGDKVSRLAGVSAMIEEGQLLLPHDASWCAAFKSELLGFPNARHDDQVDALSQLLAYVRTLQARGEPRIRIL